MSNHIAILEYKSNIVVPAVRKFVAADKFCEGEIIDGIYVRWVGRNFKERFLPKIECASGLKSLAVNSLLNHSNDAAIVAALGDEESVETALGQAWESLKAIDQKFWHVAYNRDVMGVLAPVCFFWGNENELFVETPYEHKKERYAGLRILSH